MRKDENVPLHMAQLVRMQSSAHPQRYRGEAHRGGGEAAQSALTFVGLKYCEYDGGGYFSVATTERLSWIRQSLGRCVAGAKVFDGIERANMRVADKGARHR